MISNVLAFLVTNRIGRFFGASGLLVMIAGIILWQTFQAGKKSRDLQNTIDQLESLRSKVTKDAEIRSLPRDERRRRLERWVRDDA